MTNTITFESNGLKSSDITPSELRERLGLPEVKSIPAGFLIGKQWNKSADHIALVSEETGKLYGIHSSGYRFVKHEQGIIDVMSAVEKNSEYGKVEWKVESFDEFKRFQAKGTFTDVKFAIQPQDIINPVIEYTNSYDKSWSESYIFGAFRVLCSNGMTTMERLFSKSIKHIGDVNRERIAIDFENTLLNFQVQSEQWSEWSQREIAIKHLDSLERMDLTQAEHDEIVYETSVKIRRRISVWMYFNLITALITHGVKSLNRRVFLASRLRKEMKSW